jgi:hypothetical protein
MRRIFTSALFILLACAFLLTGCSAESDCGGDCSGETDDPADTNLDDQPAEQDDTDPYAQYTDAELVDMGKQGLSSNTYRAAQDYFGALLKRNPDNTDALYGLCLADIQHWVELFNTVLKMVTGDSALIPRLMEGDDVDPQHPLADLVAQLFDDMQALNEAQQARLDKLKLMPDATFNLDRFPLNIKDEPVMALGTEWDLADAYMMDALTKGLYTAIVLLNSQDWADTRISYIYSELIGGDPEVSIVGQLMNLINVYPTFLALKPNGEGAAQFARAKEAMTGMATNILTAYSLMEAETDNQRNDVLAIGLTTRGVKHLVLQGEFYHPDGTKESVRLLWEGEKYGLKVMADRILANMNGETDMRLRVEHEVLAPVAMVVDFIKETLTINGLLEIFGFNVDPELIGLVDDINARTSEDVPKTVIGLLKTALFNPGIIELDMNAFLSRPLDFRSLLPNHPTDPELLTGSFYSEYECARLGWRDASLVDLLLTSGGPLGLTLIDPLTPDLGDAVKVDIQVIRTVEDVESIVDAETVTLDRLDDMENTFAGLFDMAVLEDLELETGTADNGVVEMSRTGTDRIKAIYLEESDPLDPLEIPAEYDNAGETTSVYSAGMQCAPGGSRDLPHFVDGTGDYFILPDDGPAVLQSAPTQAADGYGAPSAYTSFRSGSINNLLWVELGALQPDDFSIVDAGFPEEMAKTDVDTLNLFLFWLGFSGGEGVSLPF